VARLTVQLGAAARVSYVAPLPTDYLPVRARHRRQPGAASRTTRRRRLPPDQRGPGTNTHGHHVEPQAFTGPDDQTIRGYTEKVFPVQRLDSTSPSSTPGNSKKRCGPRAPSDRRPVDDQARLLIVRRNGPRPRSWRRPARQRATRRRTQSARPLSANQHALGAQFEALRNT